MHAISTFLITLLIGLATPLEAKTGWQLIPRSWISPPPAIVETVSPTPSLEPSSMPSLKPTQKVSPAKTTPPSTPVTKSASGSIKINRPVPDQVYNVTETAFVETEITGNVTRAELTIGSDFTVQTLTTRPFTFTLTLDNHLHGITGNQLLPIAVKAFFQDGTTAYASQAVYVLPAGAAKTSSVAPSQTNISNKTLTFQRQSASANPQASANSTFAITYFNEVTTQLNVTMAGNVYHLKANTDYDLFVTTKIGDVQAGTLHTDAAGQAKINHGFSTFKLRPCEIFSLGIKEKNGSQIDLLAHQVTDPCR